MTPAEWPFEVGGLDPTVLAGQYGTPLFLYAAERMRSRVDQFRSAFSDLDTRVLYACKANSNLSVLRLMQEQGLGLDTVSPFEIEIGLRAGFSPRQILFTPNCVDFTEIQAAVEVGVGINLENLAHLEAFGRRYGAEVPCMLRLKPGLSGPPHGAEDSGALDQWQHQSKFGIAWSQLDQARAMARRHSMVISGLHLHSSSVVMNPGVFRGGVQALFQAAESFEQVQELDFGGGIQPPVWPHDPEPDLNGLAAVLAEEASVFSDRGGRTLSFAFEPGRYLVADAGMLLVRANLVKNNGFVDIVGVDSGFHHLVRPMLYQAEHPIYNLSRPMAPPRRYNIDGCLCEIDHLACDREIPQVEPGDLLAVTWAGAYGFSMASQYNSRPRPAEVLVDQGSARLVRRAEKLSDLLSTQEGLPD